MEEIIKLKAHNGAIIEVNTNIEACRKFSNFQPLDIIAKENRKAIVVGIGKNPATGIMEFWKHESGDKGITSTDPKKWTLLDQKGMEEIILEEMMKPIKCEDSPEEEIAIMATNF